MRRQTAPEQAHRIVLAPGEIRGEEAVLSHANTHHAREVLRLRHGELLRGLVPAAGQSGGYDLILHVADLWEGRLHCHVVGRIELPPEPRLAVTLWQGLTRGERFEQTLQKCTEIGTAEFVPLMTERTVLRLEGRQLDMRAQRWARIVEEAALQSGRSRIPSISVPVRIAEVPELVATAPAHLSLVAYERERRPLRAVLADYIAQGQDPPLTARIAVGPEGGLAETEVDLLVKAGFTPVSLGPRTLRTETAGPVLSALLLYEFADLGGHPGG